MTTGIPWIGQLTAAEAETELDRLWEEREAAIRASVYDEVERLNLLITVVMKRLDPIKGSSLRIRRTAKIAAALLSAFEAFFGWSEAEPCNLCHPEVI